MENISCFKKKLSFTGKVGRVATSVLRDIHTGRSSLPLCGSGWRSTEQASDGLGGGGGSTGLKVFIALVHICAVCRTRVTAI